MPRIAARDAPVEASPIRGRRALVAGSLPLVMLGATLFSMLVASMWRPRHDAPLMLYVGFLMDAHAWVPYRDFFEMNPPGTHLFHQALAWLTGLVESRVRAVDLAWLAGIQLTSVLLLRRWGLGVGVAAACLFSLQYLSWGAWQSFQRDFVCVLPLALALLLALRMSAWPLALRAVGIGLLCGAVVTLKPDLGIAFPILLAGLVAHSRAQSPTASASWVGAVACGSAGFVVAPTACLTYLRVHGALPGFREMATGYWPLYAQLRHDGSVRTDAFEIERFTTLLERWWDFDFLLIAAVGLFVVVRALRRRGAADRVEIITLLALALAFSGALFVGGKYWAYHALPLYWVLSLLGGFALLGLGRPAERPAVTALRWALVGVLFAYPLRMPEAHAHLLGGGRYRIHPDVEYVADLLRGNLRDGETVQPLDVAGGGAIHAMLLARAPLATPFIYDFHFYHHADTPFIRMLRQRLIDALRAAPPRYIVSWTRPGWPAGRGQGDGFPALERLLREDYRTLWVGGKLTVRELHGADRG